MRKPRDFLSARSAIRLPRLQIHQRLDDAATVRTAIDVVAEKDESRQAPIGMTLAERNQIAQFLQRAVNIPNGIDKHLAKQIGSMTPGTTVKLTVWRKGEEKSDLGSSPRVSEKPLRVPHHHGSASLGLAALFLLARA